MTARTRLVKVRTQAVWPALFRACDRAQAYTYSCGCLHSEAVFRKRWVARVLEMQLVTSAVAQELKELSRLGGDTGITLQPDENNIHVWKAYIKVCCFF